MITNHIIFVLGIAIAILTEIAIYSFTRNLSSRIYIIRFDNVGFLHTDQLVTLIQLTEFEYMLMDWCIPDDR